MKKIEVKINGEWRKVIYVRSGYVDIHRDVDGVFASLRLEPREEGGSEGCTFRSIEDIRLVDKSECKCEPSNISYLSNPPQNKCKYCGQMWVGGEKIPSCKKHMNRIKKLDCSEFPLNLADTSSDPINQLQDKVNEIIERLNERH